MTVRMRQNRLVSQHLEVALVYKEMLGIDEAKAYLLQANVPGHIAERVLCTEQKRNGFDPTSESHAPIPPPAGCRRRNHLHDAIVEAALKIQGKLGDHWARTLLKNEHVPDEVTERILGLGPRQLRAKAPRR